MVRMTRNQQCPRCCLHVIRFLDLMKFPSAVSPNADAHR